MERRGLFLVLEGVEGAGKSTQARRLAAWLVSRGLDCVQTREPGGTELGEEIRRMLLDGGAIPARSELLLMLAARAALVDEVVRPALEAGRIVVADRFELSTLAYQGFGRDLGEERVRELNAFATGGLRPDLTILLDVPPAVGAARRDAERGSDRIEREAAAFHERVAGAYRALAQRDERAAVVDGTRAVEDVERAIRELFGTRFPETIAAAPG